MVLNLLDISFTPDFLGSTSESRWYMAVKPHPSLCAVSKFAICILKNVVMTTLVVEFVLACGHQSAKEKYSPQSFRYQKDGPMHCPVTNHLVNAWTAESWQLKHEVPGRCRNSIMSWGAKQHQIAQNVVQWCLSAKHTSEGKLPMPSFPSYSNAPFFGSILRIWVSDLNKRKKCFHFHIRPLPPRSLHYIKGLTLRLGEVIENKKILMGSASKLKASLTSSWFMWCLKTQTQNTALDTGRRLRSSM